MIKVVSLQEIKDEKMKFTILSSELRKKLSTVGSVLASSSSNSTNPILENFLFEVNQSKLTITASDGETTLVTSLEVNSEDVFKIAVPAKMLQTLMKTFVEQPLTFIVEGMIKMYLLSPLIMKMSIHHYLILMQEKLLQYHQKCYIRLF